MIGLTNDQMIDATDLGNRGAFLSVLVRKFPYRNLKFPRENLVFICFFVYKKRVTWVSDRSLSSSFLLPPAGQGADETSKPKRVTQPFRGHQKAGARRHQRASIGGGGRARAGGREREGRARRHSSGEFTGRDVVKRERARAWLP